MPLLSRRKELAVQSLILKLVNNNCPELRAMCEGPRLDHRVNLTVVVLVVPVEGHRLRVDEVFTAVTKEFSNTGMAIVLDKPRPLEEVIVGFRLQREICFVRGKVRHIHPMGGGFYQLGLKLTETINPGDHPELNAFIF